MGSTSLVKAGAQLADTESTIVQRQKITAAFRARETIKKHTQDATPMTTTLIDSPVRATPTQKIETLESKNNKDGRADASEFGQVMSGVLNPASRNAATAASTGEQETAIAKQADGQAMADMGLSRLMGPVGGDFLKAVHWGPHLNVITPETTLPDEQSLEAFARSQGLDETAVQWLMGTVPAALPVDTGLQNGATVISAEAMGTANTTSASTVTGATLPPAATSGAVTEPDMQIAQNALNSAALWVMGQSTEKARANAASPEATADAAEVQLQLLATPPAPAAVWMLRNGLSANQIKDTVTPKTAIALSEIDLSQVATPELLDSLMQEGDTASAAHPTPLSGHSGHRLEASTAAPQADTGQADNLPPAGANAAQRSEKVQDLAEKMGQAVGQRILSEIEKGQWHLKLSLRPATLGHIEVEMRMRSGEMDAVFTAPQALTRELLQEGMSKLRETLSQMGMNVASLNVGDGQTQQRGGESTPDQMSKSAKTENNDPTPLAAPVLNAPRMKMGQDGWDVLV